MWTPLEGINNALEYATVFFPEWQLYRWQAETLLQLSGHADGRPDSPQLSPTADAPLRYTIQAANGSGKDAFVIAIVALYMLHCKARFRVVGTSSSFAQLKNQTWKFIKANAERINDAMKRRLAR